MPRERQAWRNSSWLSIKLPWYLTLSPNATPNSILANVKLCSSACQRWLLERQLRSKLSNFYLTEGLHIQLRTAWRGKRNHVCMMSKQWTISRGALRVRGQSSPCWEQDYQLHPDCRHSEVQVVSGEDIRPWTWQLQRLLPQIQAWCGHSTPTGDNVLSPHSQIEHTWLWQDWQDINQGTWHLVRT